MEHKCHLTKMRVEPADPVRYFLHAENDEVLLNNLLGFEISINYLKEIFCIRCGRKTNKSFAQGYCYPCFRTAPETEECVLRPELCRAHEGIARDMDFARRHCLIDHYVYLAFTGNIKVGVTRHTQIPVRWFDQGASAAIKIAQTPNRYTAGVIETALKTNLPDKTNWKKMLCSLTEFPDLISEKQKALDHFPEELKQYASFDDTIARIQYPVNKTSTTYKSIDLDKIHFFADILIGIKGQYLIFNNGNVINIRKYGGYMVELKF